MTLDMAPRQSCAAGVGLLEIGRSCLHWKRGRPISACRRSPPSRRCYWAAASSPALSGRACCYRLLRLLPLIILADSRRLVSSSTGVRKGHDRVVTCNSTVRLPSSSSSCPS